MLLLAGFVISATAIVAIGAYTALQSGSTQVAERTNRPVVDLFLNTRERATSFFDVITAEDTAVSVHQNLDGYLFSQYQTANSMSLELNASLAKEDSAAPKDETAFLNATSHYVDLAGDPLWSQHGEECFGAMTDDGTNDGLITDDDGRVLAAIFWIEVESVDAELEEYVVIDVPDTEPPNAC